MARPKKAVPFEPTRREETVLLGHYEAAEQYCENYDARDPYLGAAPQREDLEYISPERKRLRAKYRSRF